MSTAASLLPIVEGWFTLDPVRLTGLRCATCGTYAFPPRVAWCPNPTCGSADLARVELSPRGRLWSWTVNHYPPPPPAVSPDPFEPYAIVAVDLPEERLVVLGRLADGVEATELEVGREMEVVRGALPDGDGGTEATWAWRPVPSPDVSGDEKSAE